MFSRQKLVIGNCLQDATEMLLRLIEWLEQALKKYVNASDGMASPAPVESDQSMLPVNVGFSCYSVYPKYVLHEVHVSICFSPRSLQVITRKLAKCSTRSPLNLGCKSRCFSWPCRFIALYVSTAVKLPCFDSIGKENCLQNFSLKKQFLGWESNLSTRWLIALHSVEKKTFVEWLKGCPFRNLTCSFRVLQFLAVVIKIATKKWMGNGIPPRAKSALFS